MAEAAAEKGCSFDWSIINPFVPWLKLEATFFDGSPTATPWIVTLQPVSGGLTWWKFIFSLQCVPSRQSDIVVADRLWIYTKLDNEVPYVREEPVYSFHTENRHAYAFHVTVSNKPHLAFDHLQITVEMSLRSQHIANPERNGIWHRDEDLKRLSKDLNRLLKDGLNYFNLRLNSTNPRSLEDPKSFLVHSFILQARWDNFFREHPHAIVDDTVAIDVSESLLSEILTYMYSGRLFSAEVLADEEAMTELFQVIDRYELHHLYRIFVGDYSQQVRGTLRGWEKIEIRFNLDDDPESPPSRKYIFKWNADPNAKSDFIFQIELFFDLDDRPFSYSLQSRCQVSMYARVNLEFVRKKGEDDTSSVVHACDYAIDSGETIESGTRYFEGDCPEFDDFIERRSEAEFRHSIRCVLCFSDGTSLIEIKRVEQLSEQLSDQLSEQLSDQMSEQLSDQMSEQMSEQLSDQMSEQLSDQMAEQLSEPMAEQLSEPMAEQLSEPMAEQLVEDSEEEWEKELEEELEEELKVQYDFPDDKKRFCVLSDHMYELLTRRDRVDLRVVCRSKNPDNPPEIHLLHKAIFAARVPKWRAVLENIPDEGFLPDEVTCICSSEAFRKLIDYIYTGKFTDFKSGFFSELDTFTTRGGMIPFNLTNYAKYLDDKFPRWV